MEALIDALMEWIVSQTKMPAVSQPAIVFASTAEMNRLAYGALGVVGNSQLRALYGRDEKTIFLKTSWTPDNLNDRSELLHELVHHFQNMDHVEAPCLAALEHQAYHLQITWLREQGVENPYNFLQTNELAIVLFSRCPDGE